MTTFQAIVDAVLRSVAGIVPLSYEWAMQMQDHIFNTGNTTKEIDFLVTLMLVLVFFILFRYDWLGLISACIKSIIQPKSLKSELRTLDQEVVIFIASISLPLILIQHWVSPLLMEAEWFSLPITQGILFLVSAGLVRFAYRWNKRMKGLNHLRILDFILILCISALSLHHALPVVLMLWIGFSITNYHYESIFKYSMLILGTLHAAHLFKLMESVTMGDALSAVGHLNGIAVMVVSFSIIWMTLENLQKTMSENTLRSFQWLQVIAGVSTFGFWFLKG